MRRLVGFAAVDHGRGREAEFWLRDPGLRATEFIRFVGFGVCRVV